ncbi:MAG: arabinose efflux permease family protein [Planctomycetota bacterium]|nr:arabinose efflux permease family protein [Planctomycetota bacterium]
MSPLLIVMLIVLVDLMGFTIVMPLLPHFAEKFHYSPTQIGLLFAAYPLCQLVAGPILGRLSDRYGRRPILAISQGGTALSFVILALSNSFGMMLFGRMLDGASGGNILVAQAYVADVTTRENRSRGMGMIGAAFGIGFVLGPLLGGLLLKLPVSDEWRLRVPFLVAAGFSTLAWILVVLRLPESLPKDSAARQQARVLSWRGVLDTVSDKRIGGLVLISALFVTAFAALEGTFSLFLEKRMSWNAEKSAYAFALLGFVSALIQGGMIRRLVPKFGEPRLILFGLAIATLGLAVMAGVSGVTMLIVAIILVGIGQGFSSPSIQGLLSRLTPSSEQGAVFGTLTSAQTLARTLNYPIANILLERYGPSAPYWEAAAVAGVTLLIAVGVLRLVSAAAPKEVAATV